MAARPVSPIEWHRASEAAERAGNLVEAGDLLDRGLAEHPQSANLANSAAAFALRRGKAALAETYFEKAARLEPANLDFQLNRAIAATEMRRYDRALALLDAAAERGKNSAKYWSVRANAERSSGQLAAAAASYDRCLAIDPSHARAAHGRARAALERGELEATTYFDRALSRNPGEADLWLGKAQALEVEGDHVGARQIAGQILARAPAFLECLTFLAQLRLAAGEDNFADHFDEAARRVPNELAIPIAHAQILASAQRSTEAAEICRAAGLRFENEPRLMLAEATYAGAAGELTHAERLFTMLQLETANRFVQECRHQIRQRDYERAEGLAEKAVALEPKDVSAWALRGLVWRLLKDERAQWLHEQAGLVQLRALEAEPGLLDRARDALHTLHDQSAFPLGQSLRGGTQTRHILFLRHETVFVELHGAVVRTLESYRATLPPFDRRHPLLRKRDTPWRTAGSWSVRLEGGGDHHAAHIHPQGLLSSALYLELPDPQEDSGPEGLLEIGRPPPDLNLDLEPLTTIVPEVGKLALFPSTLYHGTTAFDRGTRMTVAFDVISGE